jgi:hypothetical protein
VHPLTPGAAHLYGRGHSDQAGLMPPPRLHGRCCHATSSPSSSPVSSPHHRCGRSALPPLTAQFSHAQVYVERHRSRPPCLRSQPKSRVAIGAVVAAAVKSSPHPCWLQQSHVNPQAPSGVAAAEELLITGRLGSSFGVAAPSLSSTTMPRCPLARPPAPPAAPPT